MNLQLSPLKPAIETNMLQYDVERDEAGGAAPDFSNLVGGSPRTSLECGCKRKGHQISVRQLVAAHPNRVSRPLFNLLSRWSRKPDPVQFKQAVLGLMYQSEIGRAALGLPPSSRTTDTANKALWHMVEDVVEPVYIYTYARAPTEFKDAILDGPALQHVRERLQSARLVCHVADTTKVLVTPPEQYPAVMAALELWKHDDGMLKTWHVIVSMSVLHALEKTVASIPSKHGVKVKRIDFLTMATREGTWYVKVKINKISLVTFCNTGRQSPFPNQPWREAVLLSLHPRTGLIGSGPGSVGVLKPQKCPAPKESAAEPID